MEISAEEKSKWRKEKNKKPWCVVRSFLLPTKQSRVGWYTSRKKSESCLIRVVPVGRSHHCCPLGDSPDSAIRTSHVRTVYVEARTAVP